MSINRGGAETLPHFFVIKLFNIVACGNNSKKMRIFGKVLET